MTLKWPASHLLTTSLSMVGVGKSPLLGLGGGAAGEIGGGAMGMCRGLREIGSAQKAFGGTGSSYGIVAGTGDLSMFVAGLVGTGRRKKRDSVALSDSETGAFKLLFNRGRSSSFACMIGAVREPSNGAQASCGIFYDRAVWSLREHSSLPHVACTFKESTSNLKGGRRMLNAGGFPVTPIASQKKSDADLWSRESPFMAQTMRSSFDPAGKVKSRGCPSVFTEYGQRRLTYFKSENIKWRKLFKVFSNDVERNATASEDLSNQAVPIQDSSVGQSIDTQTEGCEGRSAIALNGLTRGTATANLKDLSVGFTEEQLIVPVEEVAESPKMDQVEPPGERVSSSDVTVICFDIETTGLHPSYHRIIEFAARDLAGGERSTIETLVNPEREVPLESERIHRISSKMVNNPDVPRWKDVALAVLDFVESRRKREGPVILVAHNGKRFDVPFIIKEFRDCGLSIPPFWRFADSMPLARSAMKSLGHKRPKLALVDLFSHYNLPSVGSAHRAMADVNMLAPVLQMIMNDLVMNVHDLLEQSFGAEEIMDKGKISMDPEVPPIEELYDGLKLQVLEKPTCDVATQSDEEALGIKRLENLAEDSLLSTVPWDALGEDSTGLKAEDEYESSLGLTLGEDWSSSDQHFDSTMVEPSMQLSDCKPSPNEECLSLPATQSTDIVLSSDGLNVRNILIGDASMLEDMESEISLQEEKILGETQEVALMSSFVEANTSQGILQSFVQGEEILQDVSSKWKRAVVGEVLPIEDPVTEKEGKENLNRQTDDLESIGGPHGISTIDSPDSLDVYMTPLLTSTVDVSRLSPMMRQYVETKRQRPSKFLLLSQVGDFYEAFFEDAKRLAEACNLRLATKDGGKLLGRKIPMAGVPVQQIDKHLQILLSKGIPVVRQEQVGAEESGLLFERQVSAVLTPGTLVDGSMLEDSFNNFLVAIMPPSDDAGIWGLAFSDISTGEFQATELRGKEAFLQEILRLQPAEVLFPVGHVSDADVDSSTPLGLPSQFCYSSRPPSDFSKVAAEKKLLLNCGAASLEGMGILNFPHALRAAGGLLGYVQETQLMASEDLPLQKLQIYSTSDSMHLNETVRKHLEMTTTSRWGKIEGSFLWSVDETRTAMGRRMLQKWLLWPLLDRRKILDRHDAVELFLKHSEVRNKLRSELEGLGDLERLTGRVGWKRASARDMLIVAQSLQLLPKVAGVVQGISLNPYITSVLRTPTAAIEVAKQVQGMLVEESASRSSGELIKNGVDTILDSLRAQVHHIGELMKAYEKQEQIRTGISSLEVGYTKPHGRFISIRKTRLKDWAVPGDYQSTQSLKAEERFTTPALLELEKLRLEALSKASAREEDLFMTLKDEMSNLLEPVQEYCKSLAEVDVICNFAELAVQWGYCRPQIVEEGREITIVNGRHPVVERCLADGVRFVPNSTYLGFIPENEGRSVTLTSEPTILASEILQEGSFPGNVLNVESLSATKLEETGQLVMDDVKISWPRPDVMILTGPNASGKSCYLRQIGLIQILAQAGSFVPAEACCLSISDGLYTRVGSVDDLAAGQSTFKVEMIESALILENATPQSLVLLDEVGRGTGSQEGEMIARAIIEYLAQQVKARTIFSTHYHDLHVLDLELPNVANYHFEAVESSSGEIIFDHAVRPGYALQSYAVGVARASGMPEWICNRASELLSDMMITGAKRGINHKVSHEGDIKFSGSSSEKQAVNSGQEENHQDVWVGSNGGMRNSLGGGKSSETWGEMFKFRRRGKSKTAPSRVRVSAGSETPQAHEMNLTEENEVLSVADVTRSRGSQVEVEERELLHDASLEEEDCGSKSATEEDSIVHKISSDAEGDLSGVWTSVCATLQNRPATQALTRQKGVLVSISRTADALSVTMGASALFVKKFQQHEHATALEAAFTAVLGEPVKLEVSILDTHDKE